MLSRCKEFKYYEPSTLAEAIILLEKYGEDAKIIAGGTDLLVAMKMKRLAPKYIINIKSIPNLNYIKYDEEKGLRIGALTKLSEIENSDIVKEKFKVIAKAAGVIGSVQIRNLATIGGNICNASPAADMIPSLLVLDAEVNMVGQKREKIIPLINFFTGPGKTVLGKEILSEVIIPNIPFNTKATYLKYSPRKAMDIAQVGVAVAITLKEKNKAIKEARIAFGGVSPTSKRIYRAEEILKDEVINNDLIKRVSQIVFDEISPISDVRGSAWYKKEMSRTMVSQILEGIIIEGD